MTPKAPRLAAASLLLAILPSCGGGNDIIIDPPPPPTTLAPFVLFQAAFPPLPPGNFVLADFTIGTPGAVGETGESGTVLITLTR